MAALLGDCLARRPLRGIPSDLEALLPLLIQGGVAPLVWGHCRDTLPPQSAAALALRHQHFTAAHDSLLAEGELSHLARAFDASGVPYLLGKGRVVAQAYASMTDRPFADFDVYVPASHYDAARAVPRHGQWRHAIDLHRGAAYLDDTSFDCLLADAATVVINDVPVRTFSEEHHLRLVCLHALAEGLMSPRWLCDVAVLVLARSPRFDWRRFEAGEAWRTRWAYVAIDLARQIFALGDDSRWPRPRPEPPGWAVRATLATWGEWRATKGMRQPMTRVRARPVTLLRALRDRWPSPLEAVAGVGCGIPQRSAFGHQLIECVRRTRRFVAEPSADPAPRLPA